MHDDNHFSRYTNMIHIIVILIGIHHFCPYFFLLPGIYFMTTAISAPPISSEITEFINSNKTATVCCTDGSKPYCFSIFYSVLADEGCLVFKSAENTTHMQILAGNNLVAGTVIASEISMAKVEGIQFEGQIIDTNTKGNKAARSYYLRYPFAVAMPGNIWVIEINSIKYTRTTNGIPHKKKWHR